MHIYYDPDEYETVFHSTPCHSCEGDMRKCNGMCTGSSSYSIVRRTPEQIAVIKAERRRKEDDEILAKAEIIKAWRKVEKKDNDKTGV
jgi:hypothetical protein